MIASEDTRERLKHVPGLVRAVRSVRSARFAAKRSVLDAPVLAGRTWRDRRIEAYLRDHDVRKLQLGTGGNVYDGWLNTDVVDFKRKNEIVYLDARKPFPLPSASFDVVFSEHMIEHLTYEDGLGCLRESLRVLRPGGRIRIATPSIDRLIRLYDDTPSDVQRRYVRWSIESFVDGASAYLPGFVLNNFFRDWGHRFIYDTQTLPHALATAGFVDVEERRVGQSDDIRLAGLERHLEGTAEFNELETIVFEGRRP
jgi:predicted SAM-dependent methyltransferase